MNFSLKSNSEMVEEAEELIFAHADYAAWMLKESEKPKPNIALYHLSVVIKLSLIFLCRKYKIGYATDYSIDRLFNETNKYLPNEIAEMAKDICYWHTDLQYTNISAMTVDEACDVGRIIQNFYNNHMVKYMSDMIDMEESTAYATSEISIF